MRMLVEPGKNGAPMKIIAIFDRSDLANVQSSLGSQSKTK